MTRRKVLLGWELGSGLGHVVPLKALGDHLERRDFDVVYVVQNTAAALTAGIQPDAIRQAPHWTPEARLPPIPRGYKDVSFSQIMGLFGIGEPACLHRMLQAWETLIASERPDVIVSDYSPALNLAVRGRLPLVIFGSGYTVPPSHLDRFPPLWPHDGPLYYDEDRLLQAIDGVLVKRSLSRLPRLPALMQGEVSANQTLAMLDPYRSFRLEPPLPPIISHRPQVLEELGDEIFLSPITRFGRNEALMRGLEQLDLPGRVLTRTLGAEAAARLAARSWHLQRSLLDLGAHAPRLRLMINYGGLGLASFALGSGLPQIIIYTDTEKFLTARALSRLGVAKAIHIDEVDTDRFVKMVAQSYIDPALHARAQALARAQAPNFASTPSGMIADMIVRLS
ncbi:hypothetical protein FHS85_003666 [Rhodoligotrophos appendicifer]|uniref:nucleotide disphospho-sugar-binding domain-containing protein n=1 Tax=Rhodoligotrophos appendicifer TaxID=987056 RepID=UPI00118491CC|nr:nucleotide disphospho-sugar-binding domain-containing protein [Rhodoligotrophos appendicifer]